MKTEISLLILKGAISEMPVDQQAKVNECADKLRATIIGYEEMGVIAMALVGIEVTLEQENNGK